MKLPFKIILLFLYVCCFPRPSNNKNNFFNSEIINRIEMENPNSEYWNLFFCKCEKGQILIIDVKTLRVIYSRKFKHLRYKDFLIETLNQRLEIPCEVGFILTINEEVRQNYYKMNIQDFLNFYCKNSTTKNEYILRKQYRDSNYKETILYFAFLNNYFSADNDLIGVDYLFRNY